MAYVFSLNTGHISKSVVPMNHLVQVKNTEVALIAVRMYSSSILWLLVIHKCTLFLSWFDLYIRFKHKWPHPLCQWVNNWFLYMDLFLLGFFVYRLTWSSSDYFSWQLTALLYVLVDDQRLAPSVTYKTIVWTQHTVGVCLHVVQWSRLSGKLAAICLMFQSNMRGKEIRKLLWMQWFFFFL